MALTATVVGAVSDGWLIMSPSGEASGSSVLNYMPRDAIANSTVLKYTNGFSVSASTNTHVLISLIGVYVKESPKRLECCDSTTNPGDYSIPGDYQFSILVRAPECNAGFSVVSLSCISGSPAGTHSAVIQSTDIEERMCVFGSMGSGGALLQAKARCCRVQ